MAGCLETLRQFFEDIEIIEKAVSLVMVEKDDHSSAYASVSDNRIFQLGLQMSQRCKLSREICDDRDQMKQEELSYLGGVQSDGTSDVWRSFYSRIQDAININTGESEYSRASLSVADWIDQSKDLAKTAASFSGEEANGQFVDMSNLHQQFLNLKRVQEYLQKDYANAQWLKKVSHWPANQPEPTEAFRVDFIAGKIKDAKPIDYITWLKTFSNLAGLPRYLKYRDPQYTAYLSAVLGYLSNYCRRQNPLLDLPAFEAETREEFRMLWEGRQIEGWETVSSELPNFSLVTDRLFANLNTFKAHQESKQFKQTSAQAENPEIAKLKSELVDMETALEEFLIKKYSQILQPRILATISEVQRRQARTAAEIAAEIQNETDNPDETTMNETETAEDDEGVVIEGAAVYNPMNLPIGWDGKPIPFWLYKMHGLGEEFKCEICGNFSYWGRKAFEKHFTETRHVHGLKCLRLEPLPAFEFITSIEEVIALSDKVNREKSRSVFNPATSAEFEDAMGNVMNLKTYQDLARQGLI